tara:strand:- start:1058 stop:1450 length:393 start_codon:yes stop_codon:yes gene_type:complete
MNLFFPIFTFITIFFEITAQYLFKISYKKPDIDNIFNRTINLFINNILHNKKHNIIIIGIIFYAITGFFVYKLLAFGHLGIINIVWHLIHFIALFFVGYFLLGEKLNIKKIIAISLGLISIILFMSDGFH